MRPQATERQASGPCSCAHDLTTVATLLRQALDIIEGPRSYQQGINDWRNQVQPHPQRTQHPRKAGER